MTSRTPSASRAALTASSRTATAPRRAPTAWTSHAARAGSTARRLTVAYAQVLFSARPLVGLLLAAATFVVPEHGLLGAVGLLSADAWARALGRPAAHVDEGFYAFNGLLVGLALGLMFRFSWPLLALTAVASLLLVLVAAGARHVAQRYLALPVLSLPFVLATWLALLAVTRFSAVEIAVEPAWAAQIGAGLLPEAVELYLRSLGACFFQLSVPAGALVFLALLIASRWAALLSILGFAAGALAYLGLGGAETDLTAHLVGFNFILTAIAIGGVMLVVSPASIALSLLSAVATAVVAAATLTALDPVALPVLAMPFVAVTLLVRYTLGLRAQPGAAVLVTGAPGSPEQNLARAAFQARRYPDPAVPLFHPPVMGRWLVTQGVDGGVTHQGPWAHAWDFEVADPSGGTFSGHGVRVEDYHCWGAPVVAPAGGTVVEAVAHLDDNQVGEVDINHNWGNLVLLWHGADVYSLVCHLQKGSVTVAAGQVVVQGQLLGKVGSSGRAPTPHLHFQAQRTREIGGPTCPAQLVHYTVCDGAGDGARVVTHGVPDEGDSITAVTPDELVRRAVALAPGAAWRWSVRDARGEREVRWRSVIDALGARHLEDERGARVGVYADAGYLTTMHYDGPADALLGAFHLGTPRVPFVGDGAAAWGDALDAGPFLGGPARLAAELARPFIEIGAVASETALTIDRRGVVVRTALDAERTLGGRRALPDTIEVVWAPLRGPVSLKAWRAGELTIEAEVIQ